MNVQIFMSPENKELIYDNDQLQEFRSLVDELGLKCNNHINPEKSPIPFMWLDESTIRAFQLLCPKVDKVENYRFEIPLEIVRNIKLSKTENYFDWIEIWSNAKDPDPFAIGRCYKDNDARNKNYTWSASTYLIGRWGAENKTIPELIDIAVKIATERVQIAAQVTIAKMKSWHECPELWAKQYIFADNSEAREAITSGNFFG